jgi:glutathione S-transferase
MSKILKLYGVPLSQPFRSVAWTMLQLEVPFKVELTIPGMSSKVGTKHENFKSLPPHGSTQVPLLIDD